MNLGHGGLALKTGLCSAPELALQLRFTGEHHAQHRLRADLTRSVWMATSSPRGIEQALSACALQARRWHADKAHLLAKKDAMVQAITIAAAPAAVGNGGNSSDKIAALQTKMVVLQKQIQKAQASMSRASEGPERDATRMQLEMLAQRMQLIQTQISDLQRQQADASTTLNMSESHAQGTARFRSINAGDGARGTRVNVYI